MLNETNYTMLLDYYELTMSNGYFLSGKSEEIAYFDVFFRKIPDGGGFAIAAGLEQIINYIKNLKFTKEDIAFLKGKGIFDDKFLEYLANFKFTGDIWAVPEGTPIFPGEPILTVRGKSCETQLIETFILLTINHQSLIATKANKIVRAAEGRPIMEFGARRAQGIDGAINGARAAFIGGCASTSCTISDRRFGVPAAGTMAHSWVQMFDSEYDAFVAYCKTYPHGATLLIDTYDIFGSGIKNAIKAFKEVLVPQGINDFGVRIDSGDIAYITKKLRRILNEEGLPQCKIVVSNSLDERIIADLIKQGAEIDSFGVGERLITSKSEPVFGGVYKLVATEREGTVIPKIKISENPEKITNPGFKKLYRIFDKETGKAQADLITLRDETIDTSAPLEIFDPQNTWKRKTFESYELREMLQPIFEGGKLVYQMPTAKESKEYCLSQVESLWDEVKRFENPHTYYVDLSEKLWDLKHELLRFNRKSK